MIMEKHVEENGEYILERKNLLHLDPTVFYNFWWNCCRFSLPLPLPINIKDCQYFWCAFAAWDKSVAEEGCQSAMKTVISLQNAIENRQADHVGCPPQVDGLT